MFILHQFTPKVVAILVASTMLLSGTLSLASPMDNTNQARTAPGGRGKLNSQPANLKFHEVSIGQNKTLPARLTNLGARSLTVSQLISNAPAYTLSGLTIPFTLAPGQNANFAVTFAPANVGQTNGKFAFISNGSNSPYYVYVYGRGVPGGVLTANPASIDFGDVQVGKGLSNYETLTNTGSAALSVSQASMTGAGFSFSGLSLPLVLEIGQRFTFSIQFEPQTSGPSSGSLVLVSDASNPNLTIPLAGTGTPGGTLSIAPASLDFGIVASGSNKSLPATLTANGASVTVTSASASSAEFTLSGLSLPLTIPSGQSQPYTVTYTPQGAGTASGTATFLSDASNSPTTQALTGTGQAPPHHSVDLSWNSSPGVMGYNIYRGGQSGGPYERVNPVLQMETGYEDDLVASGQTYYYVATAVNGDGKESIYSNEALAVIPQP